MLLHTRNWPLILGFAVSMNAGAALQTFSFEGTLTNTVGAVGSLFSAGNGFTGSYTFESTTAGSPSLLEPGLTYYDAAVTSFSVTLNGLTYSSGAGPQVAVRDNSFLVGAGFTADLFWAQNNLAAPITGPAVGGSPADFWTVYLLDDNATALSSLALPATIPGPESWPVSLFQLGFGASGVVNGTLSSYSLSAPLAPIPEPETYAMLTAGLAFLGFQGARRKKVQRAT